MADRRNEYMTNKKQAARLQVPSGMSWRDYLKALAERIGTVKGVCDALCVDVNTAKKWYSRERLDLGARVVCIDLDDEARKRFEAEQAAGAQRAAA